MFRSVRTASGSSSLLLLRCGIWGLNSGYEVWQQTPLSTEPVHWSRLFILTEHFNRRTFYCMSSCPRWVGGKVCMVTVGRAKMSGTLFFQSFFWLFWFNLKTTLPRRFVVSCFSFLADKGSSGTILSPAAHLFTWSHLYISLEGSGILIWLGKQRQGWHRCLVLERNKPGHPGQEDFRKKCVELKGWMLFFWQNSFGGILKSILYYLSVTS